MKTVRSWVQVFVLSAAALFAGGCDQGETTPKVASPENAAPFAQHFPFTIGGKTVQLQLAVTREEGAQGLMHRRSLGEDEGMLFIYAAPQAMSFWMPNVPINLSIGFFSPQGELKEIYTMYANDAKPTPSASAQLQYALEMREGWFRENGVRPGTRIDLDELRAALRARGFKPESYGLGQE